MNPLFKVWCRVYQNVMKVAAAVLPWRKPELIEGKNSIVKLPSVIKANGHKNVLIVTDSMLMSLGLVDSLMAELKNQGIVYTVYDKVVPNPTIDNIEEALKMYIENKCEAIVAFGGGSPMDCAKGVGARVARPNKTIAQMKGVLKVRKHLPTLYAIPTTSGTGSEATLAAVVTNSATHEKYPLNDVMLIPRYAVLDPMLTLKLPKHITSTTGMDALTHAVEAFIGNGNTKETKAMAIKATKLIFNNLEKAYNDGSNVEARQNMQHASYYAGVAFTRAYVGYVHAIAHTLGGFYHVPHGLANAIILPHILDYYGESAYAKLALLANEVGIKGADDAEKAKKFIQEIKDMNERMQIPTKVSGIKEEDIPTMVQRALKEANPLYPVPKFMDKVEMTAMFHEIKE